MSPAWKSWAGYTFEGICLKHVEKIRSALEIEAVGCEVGTWRYLPPTGSSERGAQIDLLFDRNDGVITVCEIKYCENKFTIDKAYALELERKIEVFRTQYKTKKQIFLALITTHGVVHITFRNQSRNM